MWFFLGLTALTVVGLVWANNERSVGYREDDTLLSEEEVDIASHEDKTQTL